jgi:hypothetical protein
MKTHVSLIVGFLSLTMAVGCSSKVVQSEKSTQEFCFHYSCDSGDEVDTFEGYIIKDLRRDGKKSVQFQISPDDAAKILTKLEEIHFFDMNSPYPSFPWGQKPTGWPNSLRVALGQQEKYLEWEGRDGTFWPVKELYELRELILSIIQSSSAWKSLPPRHGFEL